MLSRTRSLVLLVLLASWAACQSSHTQNRITISDPASGEPAVIQIRAANGEIYSVVPERGDSTPDPAEASPTITSTPSPTRSTPRNAPKLVYNSVQTDRPVVAMTFDDGPHATLTPKLLDLLKSRNIRATFYVVGRNVQTYPEIAKRIVDEGHEIANHTWSHPYLTKIGASRVKSEMDQTTEVIRKVTGVTPVTMRPPYGATGSALNRRMNEEFKMPVIMWSVDPQDWRYRNASRVSSEILSKAKPGDIILAHDIHASTIAAMPAVFDGLLKKGFQFVTVSELLKYDGVMNLPPETPAPLKAETTATPEALPAESAEQKIEEAADAGN